ncbi:putative Transposon TX1, partial [Sesbania bispinosa]
TGTNEEVNGPKENQDSQESFQPMEKEGNFKNKNALTTTKSGFENQDSNDVGVYGPWMLVKKVPRKKHQGKIVSSSNPQKNTQLNNPE